MHGAEARVIAAAADLKPEIDVARQRIDDGTADTLDERLVRLGEVLADLPEVWFHPKPHGAWAEYPD